jgi:acyl-coenzyme A synthetase/AMP-(fatty) acid ligase
VKEVAVVPVPDEIREQEVFACIVAAPEVALSNGTVDEILARAAERLTYFKLPAYVAFVDSLPLTANQKRRYGAITELAQSLLSSRSSRVFDVRHAKRSYRRTL